jgi:hypothetical protein
MKKSISGAKKTLSVMKKSLGGGKRTLKFNLVLVHL